VEPEKQSLLANGSERTFVSRQRLGKHVPAGTNKHATIVVLLETVFSVRFVQRKTTRASESGEPVWRRGRIRSP
jgi:hypothetical protein